MAKKQDVYTTLRTGEKTFANNGEILDHYHKNKMGGGVDVYKNGKLYNRYVLSSPHVQDRTGWGH